MNKIIISGNHRYVLDRTRFEYVRAVGNVAFMLDKHKKDPDSSFLESDMFKQLEKRVEEACLQNNITNIGVMCHILGVADDGEYHLPEDYNIQYDKNTHHYILTYHDSELEFSNEKNK